MTQDDNNAAKVREALVEPIALIRRIIENARQDNLEISLSISNAWNCEPYLTISRKL